MFEVDARRIFAERDKVDVDFGQQLRIITPVGPDPPSEHHAARRFPFDNIAPVAFAAVLADFVPAAARPRLDDDVLHRRFADRIWAVVASGELGSDHRRSAYRGRRRVARAFLEFRDDRRHCKGRMLPRARCARVELGTLIALAQAAFVYRRWSRCSELTTPLRYLSHPSWARLGRCNLALSAEGLANVLY